MVLGFQFLDTGPSYCTKRTLRIVNPKFMLHMLRALSFYLFIIITSRGRVPNANVLIMSAFFCLLRRKDKISFFFRGLFSSDHSKGLPHHKGPIRLWCGGGPTWRWEFNCPPPPSQTPPLPSSKSTPPAHFPNLSGQVAPPAPPLSGAQLMLRSVDKNLRHSSALKRILCAHNLHLSTLWGLNTIEHLLKSGDRVMVLLYLLY